VSQCESFAEKDGLPIDHTWGGVCVIGESPSLFIFEAVQSPTVRDADSAECTTYCAWPL